MYYKSTRGNEKKISSAQAIIRGLADDKGLYVPEEIPSLPFEIKDMINKSYKEIALPILGAFFDDFTYEELKHCVDGAYTDKFDDDEIVPIKKTEKCYFLELFHGRTAAFKDMALSILPYLLTTAIKKENEKKKVCILVATSGDTGKAALEGFADVPGTEIIVFYPNKGVSKIQEQQMVTQEGDNTHVFAINGNFDDAQNGVKEIFNDEEFSRQVEEKGIRISSANSINIGRLIPQVVYYVYSYIKLVESGEIKDKDSINVVVPTGNFGNILAAYYAKQMGIPINKFICASNENKVLADFLNTGKYDIDRDFHLTSSPSMDILISSNLERLLYILAEQDGNEVRRYMSQLYDDSGYEISEKIKLGLNDFVGGCAGMNKVSEAIGNLYNEENYLIDTHTAVAYCVYSDYVKKTSDSTPTIIASTASAYKFAESVADALGIDKGKDGFESVLKVKEKTGVFVPEGLRNLDKKRVRHDGLIDIDEMKQTILKCKK